MNMDDQRAYAFICPNCNAQPGCKCTEATPAGRKPVAYIHFARTNLLKRRR